MNNHVIPVKYIVDLPLRVFVDCFDAVDPVMATVRVFSDGELIDVQRQQILTSI